MLRLFFASRGGEGGDEEEPPEMCSFGVDAAAETLAMARSRRRALDSGSAGSSRTRGRRCLRIARECALWRQTSPESAGVVTARVIAREIWVARVMDGLGDAADLVVAGAER